VRDVTLCIVNYNGAVHLPHAFEALRAQDHSFREVLLVDNASTDSSLDTVTALWPDARVVRLPRNLGPGAARNAGFAAARHDLILFQDNDVRLQPDTARRLIADLQAHPGTLAVAPRVLYASDPERVQFDSADCHFLGLMATRNADVPAHVAGGSAADTTSMVTACFLFDRARWQGGDPFDEGLGFNLEDHDFAVRACVIGHRLRVEPRARVLHGSGTPGLSYRPGQRPTEDRQFYLTRNRWIVVARCYAPRTLRVLAPALLLFEVLVLGGLTLQRRPHVWFRALASFWRNRQRVLASRREVQRGRRRPDGEILRDGPLPLTAYTVSGRATRQVARTADRLLRAYWRRAHRWLEGG
jgi:GT2 family glycosyltransferase